MIRNLLSRARGEALRVAVQTKVKHTLLGPAYYYNTSFAYMSRINMACSRGALSAAMRRVDARRPTTWEFTAFSQNGEDGIIEHLLGLSDSDNRYFVEIGASDGLENNSAHLALVGKYDGVMVEADPLRSRAAQRFLGPLNWSVRFLTLEVSPSNVFKIAAVAQRLDPALLSLDIDSNDYHIAKACLAYGFRPHIVCVEYNSAFGPDLRVTIPYTPGLDYLAAHPMGLYYGASVGAWRALFAAWGYRFVTVDTRGVNAFFVDDTVTLPDGLEGLVFAENATQLMRCGVDWRGQLELLAGYALETV